MTLVISPGWAWDAEAGLRTGVHVIIRDGAVASRTLLLSPSGALAVVPVLWRWGALAAGLVAFFVLRKSMIAGVLVAEAVLISAAYIATR